MTKRKDKRRELLKQDDFLNSMERAVRYAQANPRKVGSWVFGVVVLLSVIAGGMKYFQVKKNSDAEALYKAEKSFLRTIDDPFSDVKYETMAEKNEAALKVLQAYAEEASGDNRAQGLVYKASCQMDLGKMDEVESTYKELAKVPGSYGAIGLMGLGDIYMGKEEYDKAIEFYNQILTNADKGLFEDLVKFRVASAYKKKGDLKSAEIELESLVQKYDALEEGEKPPVHQDAKTMLEEIKKENETS